MRIEVVAVGTELLLGQIADTNSAWLGEQLALAGVDSHFHQAVGDNQERIVLALRTALARSDGVVVCGGLGPTHDDITRDAIAEVMGVALVRDPAIIERIGEMFSSRGRAMPESNGRQADVPERATPIPQQLGTAPGLICPVGHKVVYALPGVPYEMYEMFSRAVLPDLRRRMAEQGDVSVIVSRVVRTWGNSESGLAELLAPRIAALDAAGGNPTIAFLASGMEGIKVRITAKAADVSAAEVLLRTEEEKVVALVGEAVFGFDDDTMESVVAAQLKTRRLSLGLAESLTGGLVASRLVGVPGASDWFRGSVVSYASDVKHDVLGVPDGPVVSAGAARAMADGARQVLGADVGLALTGVAGPDPQEGLVPGTVFIGLSRSGGETESLEAHLPGDRDRVRQYATITALDLLRRRLLHDGDGTTSPLTKSGGSCPAQG
ncbi:MAG TPA: competence/damage-inducible protein A [Acidimicrobiales bacterium]|nr:competence/damage-inducible protein A [Acidimicrobiales bacterium]